MAKAAPVESLCLGRFVLFKEPNPAENSGRKKKSKTKSFGYIRAKNADDDCYEIVTLISANSNTSIQVKENELEVVPVALIKNYLAEVAANSSFDEYQTFVELHNAFPYKLVTIPLPEGAKDD